MAPKMATMDAEDLALCNLYKQPPGGGKPLACSKIAAKVKRRDGQHPTAQGVCSAACFLGVAICEEHSVSTRDRGQDHIVGIRPFNAASIAERRPTARHRPAGGVALKGPISIV